MKRNVFIDCGFHHGEGLKHFVDLLGIHDKNWLIVAFEANPECRIDQRILRVGVNDPEVFVKQCAVWIYDGRVDFRQEDHISSQSGSPSDGISEIDGWASQVAGLNGQSLGLCTPVSVPCIDFSNYLTRFADKSKWTVYCKMDIEGSEFPVLRKILTDGNVGIFEKLWVEFHERFIPGEDAQSKNHLINELSKYTKVDEWD